LEIIQLAVEVVWAYRLDLWPCWGRNVPELCTLWYWSYC